jgi:ribonuclease E
MSYKGRNTNDSSQNRKRRILIDAAHREETRVVVVDQGKVEELDFEIESSKQLKGNIYLAKIIRIEPSLQAAFVEYGGNRHGFLPFPEIHPDYFRIPVADREKLKEMQIAEAERLLEEDEEEGNDEDLPPSPDRPFDDFAEAPSEASSTQELSADVPAESPVIAEVVEETSEVDVVSAPVSAEPETAVTEQVAEVLPTIDSIPAPLEPVSSSEDEINLYESFALKVEKPTNPFVVSSDIIDQPMVDFAKGVDEGNAFMSNLDHIDHSDASPFEAPDEGLDSSQERENNRRSNPRRRQRQGSESKNFSLHRMYKIQEVLHKGQVLLIQVVKDERQNKGAAVTTYLSLPGRYCVLMPNNPRGGGISRKISDIQERRKLKETIKDLDVPKGMGVIIRTAGINKNTVEIKRDLEYLFRLWDQIREDTLVSTAPSLVYEEANLVKRSIRDLYSRDIDEIIVDGDEGFKTAKNFMRMLLPSHTRKVIQYQNRDVPLFVKYNLEKQIETIHNQIVRLKSGGYLVIDITEALVSIDINSGRATKERNIRETAFKTNLEAAQEIPKQLRLRDLAGLIVIDFIDMDNSRNNGIIEKTLREGLKDDRARVQIGHISQFGLLELSRQRLRPSIFETHFSACPNCAGSGYIRSKESAALAALREIQEMVTHDQTIQSLILYVPVSVALYMLNNKRQQIDQIESSCDIQIIIETDDQLVGSYHQIKVTSHRSAQDQQKSGEKRKGPSRQRRQGISNEDTRGQGSDEDQNLPADLDDVDQEGLEALDQQESRKDDEQEDSSENQPNASGSRNNRRRSRRGNRRSGRTGQNESKSFEGAEENLIASASPESEHFGESASHVDEFSKEPLMETEFSEAPVVTSEEAADSAKSDSKDGRRPRRSQYRRRGPRPTKEPKDSQESQNVSEMSAPAEGVIAPVVAESANQDSADETVKKKSNR